MKDKRIWIVVGCILVIEASATHYTRYCVNSQGAVMMAKILVGAEETVASSFVPALGQLDTEASEADAGITIGRVAPATPTERKMTGDAGSGNAASGNTASGDAGPGGVGPGNVAYATASAAEAAGTFSSDHAAPVMTDAVEGIMTLDTVGPAGTVEEAAVSETASEKDMPISPLTGARAREYKASRVVDYRKRLEDLDAQTLKMREEETDSSVYSTKTSVETELKLWEGELDSIYSALMEMLSQEDRTGLTPEQQEWLKNRDARAVESSGRSSGSMEGTSYVAALVSLTGGKAYEPADCYGKASGAFYEDEDFSQAASPQQAKTRKGQFA